MRELPKQQLKTPVYEWSFYNICRLIRLPLGFRNLYNFNTRNLQKQQQQQQEYGGRSLLYFLNTWAEVTNTEILSPMDKK